MAWKLGTDLTPQDQEIALVKFTDGLMGSSAADQFLGRHRFRVNGKGRLDRRARNCYPVGDRSMFTADK